MGDICQNNALAPLRADAIHWQSRFTFPAQPPDKDRHIATAFAHLPFGAAKLRHTTRV